MCKYIFQDNKCCNPAIDSDECIGLDNCHIFSGSKEIEMGDCTFEAWYGLYCPKYKRFFCPGKGNCDTFEQYMENFTGFGRGSSS